MRGKTRILLAIGALAGLGSRAKADIMLGAAGEFAVLAGTAVTNAGLTAIDGGGVGVSPGAAITGFPPGTIAAPFTTHAGDAAAIQAEADLAIAYAAAAGLVPTMDLTGQDLGGLTLLPGVYSFATSAQLTGVLTLNDLGDPDAQFVFQVGTTLTTASGSSVVTLNGGPMPGCDVFWQVGTSATLGAGTAFEGHLLALTSITLAHGATILDGGALAIHGAVTLDTNQITNCVTAVPEPATMALALVAAALLRVPALRGGWRDRRSRRAGSTGG